MSFIQGNLFWFGDGVARDSISEKLTFKLSYKGLSRHNKRWEWVRKSIDSGKSVYKQLVRLKRKLKKSSKTGVQAAGVSTEWEQVSEASEGSFDLILVDQA